MPRISEQNAPEGPVCDQWRNLVARATALCRTVAGVDLAGRPLYILLQTQAAAILGPENESDGYTTPNLDLMLREVIGDAWMGRGPCMVINDVAIAADHFPEDVEGIVMTTALHELAHVLERPPAGGALPTSGRVAFETLVVASAIQLPQRTLPEPWFGHESAFIRIALHLGYRAAAAGMFLFPGVLCAGRRYGLSHVSLYTDALGNEPERLNDRPICEIIHQTPPVAFTQLWNADVQRYGGIEVLRQENDDDGIGEFDRANHAPAATAAD